MSDYALLWSKSQNCFHIEPLLETLRKNRFAFANDKRLNDYHVIAVGSLQAMYDAADAGRKTLTDREKTHA